MLGSRFYDIHTHVYSEVLRSDPALLSKCNITIVDTGVDLKTNYEVLSLSLSHSNVIPALGFHPEYITRSEEASDSLKLVEMFKLPISEVGLDYHWVKEIHLRRRQVDLLIKFFEVAERQKRPLILHIRGGLQDLMNLLPSYHVRVAVHAYEGSVRDARRLTDMGHYVSVPPVVLRDKTRQAVVREVPLSNLLTETDAPYLSHERGVTSEPCHVTYVVKYLAQVRGIGEEDCAMELERNSRSFLADVIKELEVEKKKIKEFLQMISDVRDSKKDL